MTQPFQRFMVILELKSVFLGYVEVAGDAEENLLEIRKNSS